MAHGGENYSPVVSIDNVECSNLQQYSNDRRIFYGSIPVTITQDTIVTVKSDTGNETTITIKRAAAGPEILTCEIGAYPGSQTAVKQGDTVSEIEFRLNQLAKDVGLNNYNVSFVNNSVNCLFNLCNDENSSWSILLNNESVNDFNIVFNHSDVLFLDYE